MKFEDFLGEFGTDIVNHQQFILNALLAAALAYLLGMFYTRYGTSIANRKKFGHNFMLLALTTMLIIYIVKSSIALSLGLVGALSIVRFRAAIKEPEELVYLFFTIGIGLGFGANQTVVTLLAFTLDHELTHYPCGFVKAPKSQITRKYVYKYLYKRSRCTGYQLYTF